MKKLLALAFIGLSVGYSHAAEPVVKYELYPRFSIGVTSVTIASAGGDSRNCITDWTLMSTIASTMTILDGSLATGTTIWGLSSAPANIPVVVTTGNKESALCGGANSPMVISITNGTPSINYRGFVK